MSTRDYYLTHADTIRPKARIRARAYYAAHAEERRAYQRAYRLAHLEEITKKKRAYQAKNAEKIAVRTRAYRQKHRAHLNAKKKEWIERNKAKRRAITTKYRKNHHDYYATHNALRRAILRSVQRREKVSLRVIYQRDNKRCSICNKHVLLKEASLDHIVPLSKGGHHTYANCALAHKLCNSRKGNTNAFAQQLFLF